MTPNGSKWLQRVHYMVLLWLKGFKAYDTLGETSTIVCYNQFIQLASYSIGLSKCLIVKMWECENVRMSECQDTRMLDVIVLVC